MRNTKIALAVLALVASTAAMADGVSVYGTIDTSIAKQTNQAMQMNHSTWGTSAIGFKGSEGLDGGMKASIQLEMGLNTATGDLGNNGSQGIFNRQANIGLSGEFGSVKLGLQTSPFIGAALGSMVTDNASFYVPALLMGTAVSPTLYLNGGSPTATGVNATGGFFVANAISYTTPSIGGFSATVLKQLSGNNGIRSTSGSQDAEDYTAASANFTAGDVSVSAGYEKNGALGAALNGAVQSSTGVVASGAATKAYTLGAAYTMGSTRLGGGIIHNDFGFGSVGTRVYHLGLAYSASEQLTLNLNYAQSNNANQSFLFDFAQLDTASVYTTANKQTIINAGAKYALSKRTYAYGSISRATNGALALYGTANTSTTGDTTGYAVGVGHNF